MSCLMDAIIRSPSIHAQKCFHSDGTPPLITFPSARLFGFLLFGNPRIIFLSVLICLTIPILRVKYNFTEGLCLVTL